MTIVISYDILGVVINLIQKTMLKGYTKAELRQIIISMNEKESRKLAFLLDQKVARLKKRYGIK